MFYDGYIEDLVTPISTNGPWTFKDAAKANQPAIPCLACHQIHAPAAGFQSVALYVRHEQASFPPTCCPSRP